MNLFEYLTHIFEDRIDFAHDAIKITSHRDAQAVQDTETVRGELPSGKGPAPTTTLQALVYSNDGKWYPQAPVTVSTQWEPNSPWSVQVAFGDGHRDGQHEYYLLAIVESAEPITAAIESLPAGVKRSRILALRKTIG